MFAECTIRSGPGGCTNEMLRVCLDDAEVFQLLFRAAEDLTRTNVPESVSKAFMVASMTALQKHDGRHHPFRRLVAKTWLVSSAKKGRQLAHRGWHWSVRPRPQKRHAHDSVQCAWFESSVAIRSGNLRSADGV